MHLAAAWAPEDDDTGCAAVRGAWQWRVMCSGQHCSAGRGTSLGAVAPSASLLPAHPFWCWLLQDIRDQYPPWLDANRGKVEPEAFARYEAQHEVVARLVAQYEQDPDDFKVLMELLQQVRGGRGRAQVHMHGWQSWQRHAVPARGTISRPCRQACPQP